eukprot:TRINITY_DN5745_c0_g1_i1.p1 TRINITY_DN5745_c0_g1~~TRINITY_DN5745_c0_g1_i1.p1  ORF type:complete len:279 (-),score=63.10 TRINITY_DN5745_c0_g1_i1:24-860(-)
MIVFCYLLMLKCANNCDSFVNSSPIRYNEFCLKVINDGYTPLFEWCSKDQPVILKHEEDSLKLTGLRNVVTGVYASYKTMVELSSEYDVPVTSLMYTHETIPPLLEFIKEIKDNTILEGCVIKFDDGDLYKLKTHWYHTLGPNLHRFNMSKHNNEKYIMKSILNNDYDDIKPYIPDDKREYLDRFADDIVENAESLGSSINNEVEQWKRVNDENDRKAFSEWVSEQDRIYQPVYFSIVNGKDPFEAVVALALRNISNHFDITTTLLGGIKFSDYKPDE